MEQSFSGELCASSKGSVGEGEDIMSSVLVKSTNANGCDWR